MKPRPARKKLAHLRIGNADDPDDIDARTEMLAGAVLGGRALYADADYARIVAPAHRRYASRGMSCKPTAIDMNHARSR